MRAGEAVGELQRRLIFIDVARFEPRRHDALHAGRSESDPPLVIENIALLEGDPVNPHSMREDGSLGLLDWR